MWLWMNWDAMLRFVFADGLVVLQSCSVGCHVYLHTLTEECRVACRTELALIFSGMPCPKV